MRRLITISFLLFIALCGWAKAGNASVKDSICIIEGTIKNLPDGCDIILYGTAGKYSGKQKTVTQIRKGKFRFEKKVKGDERYCLFLYPCVESLDLYVSPGTKANITGNDAHPSVWNVKSDNPMQQEWNAYQKTEMDSLAEYTAIRLRINEIDARLSVINTDNEKEKLLTEKNKLAEKFSGLCSEYVKSMYNFMKDRAYSDIFSDKLRYMADKVIENTLDDTYSDIIVELLQKIPKEDLQDYNIVYIKRIMGMKKDPYPTEIHKSTSRAISTSAKDAGWCTFYDAEKSYETDGHTDIYIIRTTDKDGIIELSDKTERIIPAGCPVILHLNNVMEDGTYRGVLTEATINKAFDFTRWNILEITSANNDIKAWRLGRSSEENEVALYPWTTDKAQSGIVYLRMPNSYIDIPKIASYKLDIGGKKPIAHTQWHTRDLKVAATASDCDIVYSQNATLTDNDIKVVNLIGQPVRMAEENRFVVTDFIVGDIAIVHKMGQREHYFYLSKFGKDGWGAPELKLISPYDGFTFPRFSKDANNSLLVLDSNSFPLGISSLSIIKNPVSLNSLNDTTKFRYHELRDMNDVLFFNGTFCWMSDSTLLAPCTTSSADGDKAFNHIFSVIDYKNMTCKPLKYWPEDGCDIKGVAKYAFYANGSRIYGNYKGRYINVFPEERNIMLFSVIGDSISKIRDVYSTPVNYETKDGHNPIRHSVRTENLSCQTSNDRIFILLLDRDKHGKRIKMEGGSERLRLYGDVIEIYDWDGRQQKRIIKLDHIGQQIKISDDHNTLYLFTASYNDGDQQIWSYDISNLDSQTGTDFQAETYEYAAYSSEDDNVKTPSKTVEVGDMMTDFELYDYDDKPHHLNEFIGNGKFTILDFSSLGCIPCQKAKPILEKFYQDNKDKFEMITISTDNSVEFWKSKPMGEVSWHEWNDHKSARKITQAYGVKAIPTFILISPEGRIEKKCLGIADFIESMKIYIP